MLLKRHEHRSPRDPCVYRGDGRHTHGGEILSRHPLPFHVRLRIYDFFHASLPILLFLHPGQTETNSIKSLSSPGLADLAVADLYVINPRRRFPGTPFYTPPRLCIHLSRYAL